MSQRRLLTMATTLMIFQAIVSVLLIIVVLLQFGKGAEAGLISSGGADSVFTGAQKGNFFTKLTIVLSIIFMGNSILLARIQSHKSGSSILDNEEPIARPLNSDPLPNPLEVQDNEAAPAPSPQKQETPKPKKEKK